MDFWAVAYKYQEDVFWDFEKEDETTDLKETCFLSTKSMAENYIEEVLSDEFTPVQINLERIEKNGVWSHSRGTVEQWDDF